MNLNVIFAMLFMKIECVIMLRVLTGNFQGVVAHAGWGHYAYVQKTDSREVKRLRMGCAECRQQRHRVSVTLETT